MLSSVTRLAGVVTLPRQSHAALSQMDSSQQSNRVLAILGRQQSRSAETTSSSSTLLTSRRAGHASNYLNTEFGGKELSAVRDHLLAQLKETREPVNEMMLNAIHLAQLVGERAASGRRG